MAEKPDTQTVKAAAACWALELTRLRDDLDITGSPERCETRVVIECSDGRSYVLESLHPGTIHHKANIHRCLTELSENGLLWVNPCLPAASGAPIAQSGDRFWQLSGYIAGVDLNRPAYVYEKWRGRVLAEFLIALRRHSAGIACFKQVPPFSLKAYIADFLNRLDRHDPKVACDIAPVVAFIRSRFMPGHDQLPAAFCHGDLHPLNIIWADQGIRAVIDWEFLGYKPAVYDIANLIGCVGMEDPRALKGGLILEFLRTLKSNGNGFEFDWPVSVLVDFVVALRFAWLAEWLRKRDWEMVELETTYMKLLVNNGKALEKAWPV